MSTPSVKLLLSDPEVTEIHVVKFPVDEEHLNWNVGYAPTDAPIPHARVVFGTIHAGNEEGFAEATVAALMAYSADEEPGDSFAEVLVQSSALESLWDIARIAFNGVTGVSGIRVDLPAKAPEPQLRVLSRSADEDESGTADDAGEDEGASLT